MTKEVAKCMVKPALPRAVRKKARYVDINKCTGCGTRQGLPVIVPNEHDVEMADRHAIYVSLPPGGAQQIHHRQARLATLQRRLPAHIDVQGYVALIAREKNR